MSRELPLFTAWLEVTGEVIERAGRFPKSLRPTIGHRLIDRSLEVLDLVVALRYTRRRDGLFREASLRIEQLRVLLRLSVERRLITPAQFGRLAESIDTCGRMLGGWKRSEGRAR